MPRRNNTTQVRMQHCGQLRQSERDRRRKRLANRAKHRDANTTAYKELSDERV